MLDFDGDKVRENVRRSATDDLLNRVTVYRDGMEPEAVQIIEEELRRRGIGSAEIFAHRMEAGRDNLVDGNGLPYKCSFCDAPAVAAGWGWHWLWGKVPLFPQYFHYCKEHEPINA